jgi:hypothetical protein
MVLLAQFIVIIKFTCGVRNYILRIECIIPQFEEYNKRTFELSIVIALQ